MTKLVYSLTLVTVVGCTSASPLVESSPQIELVTNPAAVAGRPPLELTLTTWSHLAALGDAVDANELAATLDGRTLTISPNETGYFGNGDSYVAAFVLPATAMAPSVTQPGTTSTLTITDHQTTWTAQVTNVMTDDLRPAAPMIAGASNTVIWPSAATSDKPWTTIDWVCVEVANREAACHRSGGDGDPGIAVSQQLVMIDLPAVAGDSFTVWGARTFSAATTGDGTPVFATVLGKVTGAFE